MDTNPDYIDHNQLSILVIEFSERLHHVGGEDIVLVPPTQ